jgi:hypothetical protein
MDPTNLPVEGSKDAVDKLKALLGTYLSVKIVHVLSHPPHVPLRSETSPIA